MVFESMATLIGLLTLTFIVVFLYGKKLHQAHEKYAEAKNALKDIVISFNSQLRRAEDRLDASVREIAVFSKTHDLIEERLEQQEKSIHSLAENVDSLSFDEALTGLKALEREVGEVTTWKDSLTQEIAEIKRERQKQPELRIESAIPIKREKALAPLTDTELTVLELLAAEGEKTAPKIRERINLSREHTARLMKKLYEGGYLERSANKIPFTYRLKEEMRKILKKPEQEG